MSNIRENFTSPVGRLVMGSLYKPNNTDADGKPLVTKTGANAGQPRVNYFLALAIPKNAGETHWASTEWGAKIWALGHKAFPAAAQRADFAWKIEDGDSAIPNKKGRKPCDNEGWKGNWILKFGSSFAPTAYRADPGNPGKWIQIMEADAIKPGYYVQIAGTVDSNESTQSPGLYLNHNMVALAGYGPEINFGMDVNEAGFGAAPLPPGASAVPLASATPLPAPPGTATPLPAAAAPPPPIPITPNPAFLQVPPPSPGSSPVPAVPGSTIPVVGTASPSSAPPPPPPPAAGPTMTALAGGASYVSFREAGWSDEAMISAGYMTR